MSENNKPRMAVLAEKLRNFFTFLLENKQVKRSPKAVSSIEMTAKVLLAVDPKSGTCPGYESLCSYIDEWVKPAFEWVETKTDRFEWRLRDGSRLLHLDDPKSKIVTWHEWLMHNNVEYYDMKETFFTPMEMKKLFQYLHCFLVLTSPFIGRNQQPQNSEIATKKIKAEAK